MSHLRPSAKRTTCSWKGVASYYDVEVDGELLESAAWYYNSCVCDREATMADIVDAPPITPHR